MAGAVDIRSRDLWHTATPRRRWPSKLGAFGGAEAEAGLGLHRCHSLKDACVPPLPWPLP